MPYFDEEQRGNCLHGCWLPVRAYVLRLANPLSKEKGAGKRIDSTAETGKEQHILHACMHACSHLSAHVRSFFTVAHVHSSNISEDQEYDIYVCVCVCVCVCVHIYIHTYTHTHKHTHTHTYIHTYIHTYVCVCVVCVCVTHSEDQCTVQACTCTLQSMYMHPCMLLAPLKYARRN